MYIKVPYRDLGIDEDGFCWVDDERTTKARPKKGKTLFTPLSDYTVVDLETTGLSSLNDEIIEIGAIKVRGGKEVGRFQSLVKPKEEISEFIEQLTGISNQMVENQPSFEEVIPRFLEFLGSDPVVGHNAHFDVNFLYDHTELLGIEFPNPLMDTIRLAKLLYKGLPSYKLKRLLKLCGIAKEVDHRALQDAENTYKLYEHMLEHARQNNIVIKPTDYGQTSKNIIPEEGKEDPDNPLFGQICVFTGTLEKMNRRTAMQLVVNIGGRVLDRVTKDTNYLILGETDYSKVREGKSSKLRQAERYQLEGFDIEIIPESLFYEMLQEL